MINEFQSFYRIKHTIQINIITETGKNLYSSGGFMNLYSILSRTYPIRNVIRCECRETITSKIFSLGSHKYIIIKNVTMRRC